MLYHQPYVFPSAEAMIRHFPPSTSSSRRSGPRRPRCIASSPRRCRTPCPGTSCRTTNALLRPHDEVGRKAVLDGYPQIPNRIVKSAWLRTCWRRAASTRRRCPSASTRSLLLRATRRGAPAARARHGAPSTPRRGFPWLVAALRELKRRRPDVEVCFFGCANLADYALDFPHVDLGIVPNDRLRRVYNDAALYLDTSAFQGFGRPALEAMACGCATVLGRHGGVTEYARDPLTADSSTRDPTPRSPPCSRSSTTKRSPAPRRGGLATAQGFSCDAEAVATSRLFARRSASMPTCARAARLRAAIRARRGPVMAAPGSTRTCSGTHRHQHAAALVRPAAGVAWWFLDPLLLIASTRWYSATDRTRRHADQQAYPLFVACAAGALALVRAGTTQGSSAFTTTRRCSPRRASIARRCCSRKWLAATGPVARTASSCWSAACCLRRPLTANLLARADPVARARRLSPASRTCLCPLRVMLRISATSTTPSCVSPGS